MLALAPEHRRVARAIFGMAMGCDETQLLADVCRLELPDLKRFVVRLQQEVQLREQHLEAQSVNELTPNVAAHVGDPAASLLRTEGCPQPSFEADASPSGPSSPVTGAASALAAQAPRERMTPQEFLAFGSLMSDLRAEAAVSSMEIDSQATVDAASPVKWHFADGAETPGHGLVWSREAEPSPAEQEDLFRDPDLDDIAEGLDADAHSVSSIPLAGLTRGDLDKVYCTGYEAEMLRMALEGQDARWEAAMVHLQAQLTDALRRIQALEHELAWSDR